MTNAHLWQRPEWTDFYCLYITVPTSSHTLRCLYNLQPRFLARIKQATNFIIRPHRTHCIDSATDVACFAICICVFVCLAHRRVDQEAVWGQTHAHTINRLLDRVHNCTLTPHGEYDWTIRARWRCGLTANYFDRLFTWTHRSRRNCPVNQ